MDSPHSADSIGPEQMRPAAAASRRAGIRDRSRGERARRSFVALVFAIYFLAIFEGALRKWVFPGAAQYLFFVRDPLLILAYVQATRHHLWPRLDSSLLIASTVILTGTLVGIIQLTLVDFEGNHLLLAIYGWRNYYLYVPLAFLTGEQFRRADVKRLLKWTLILSVPTAILVGLQFAAPIDAAINVGIAADKAEQFHGLGLNGEHTRPQGLFTSGVGQGLFVASCVAAWLSFAVRPARTRDMGILFALISGAGILSCLALSGSRGAVIQCSIIGAACITLGLLGRSTRLRWNAAVVPILVAVLAVALFPVAFPDSFEAFQERWQTAGTVEDQEFVGGVFGRAFYSFVDFTRVLDDAPLLGYGLGFGGNGAGSGRSGLHHRTGRGGGLDERHDSGSGQRHPRQHQFRRGR